MAEMRAVLTVNGAEARLLIAELCYFLTAIGLAEVERIIGRAVDGDYIASLTYVQSYRRYGLDVCVYPAPELERALAALWVAA
jgi:hypothetical protein